MKMDKMTKDQLLAENEDLRRRLEEAGETLDAIYHGEVDALIVAGADGDQVFTLKGAETPYRILLETMNEGAVTLIADGTIIYCNKRFAEMIKMRPLQVINSSIYDVIPPEEKKLFDGILRQRGKGEISLRAKDEVNIPVYLSCSSMETGDTLLVSMVVTDLSEQKRSEEILKAGSISRSILDQATESIIVCDMNGQITRASRMAHELCDKNLLLQHFDDMFALWVIQEGASRSRFSILMPLKGELVFSVGVSFSRDDGKVFDLLLSARPLLDQKKKIQGCIVTMVDITEMKRASEAIKVSETRYHRLFEAARDGILILDYETEKVLDVNTIMMEMSCCPHECYLGKKLWEIDVFKDIETIKAAVGELRARGSFRFEDLKLDLKDGRTIPIEFVGSVYNVNNSKVIQCNIRDITERKLMLEALKRSKNELEQRVNERTLELQKALCEIKAMKDRLEAENIYFRHEIRARNKHLHILGQSDCLRHVLYRAEQVAPSNTTVLILGETGTGKDLIADAIHNISTRKNRPLITVNCAALPANLIESELFGREKGAFTGADARQIGRFEIANGSTICLDEIGELPLDLQSKLLRVIQHNEFERLGSSHTIKVDVRIIATTNRDLEKEMQKGRFRQDLYFRLNVFPITVPPLRQRADDIPILVEAFIERYAKKLGKQIMSIQQETMKMLKEYTWPGNVRELENVIERALILCNGPVFQLADRLDNLLSPLSAMMTLEEMERAQILKTLSQTRWLINGKNGAAAILGLHPSTLRARMHKLGIVRPEIKEPY